MCKRTFFLKDRLLKWSIWVCLQILFHLRHKRPLPKCQASSHFKIRIWISAYFRLWEIILIIIIIFDNCFIPFLSISKKNPFKSKSTGWSCTHSSSFLAKNMPSRYLSLPNFSVCLIHFKERCAHLSLVVVLSLDVVKDYY